MELSIIAEIAQYHNRVGSWAVVAKLMRKSPAYAMRVVRGDLHLSEEAADAWIRNYRNQYAGKVLIPICPTCGDAHVVGDCHGKDGHPVILAANEEVRLTSLHPARQRPHRVRREMTADQAAVWDNLTKVQKNTILGVRMAGSK
ncbi:MAG: hypothetical protein DDT21_01892 [Syntrophomonadaceae bacterium]|nr:hypothetical protein [Bacillota bacterium]